MKHFGLGVFKIEVLDDNINGLLAPIRIYINNNILGDYSRLSYLPSFCTCMEALLEKCKKEPISKNELGLDYYRNKLLLASSPAANDIKYIENYDDYLFDFGDAFDNYNIRIATKNNGFYILWYSYFIDENSDIGIYFSSIPYVDFYDSFNKFKKWYDILIIDNPNRG